MTPLEIATAAALASVLSIWWVRRRESRMTTLAAAAGRALPAVTIVVGVALAATAVATALLTVRADPAGAAARTRGRTVLVLDVSGSLSGGQAHPVADTLRAQALESGPTAGLVIFADSAIEALPATTPAVAVVRLSRFFDVSDPSFFERIAGNGSAIYATRAPWPGAFLGNTAISTGIDLARQMLANTRTTSGGRVVVISDLLDGEPGGLLGRAITRARLAGIDVVAAPVDAMTPSIAQWKRLGGTIAPAREPAHASGLIAAVDHPPGRRSVVPATCALAFGLLVVSLQLWTRPLRLPREPRPAERRGV